jgi:hypothetical protein
MTFIPQHPEPDEVIKARATLRAWELRNGHAVYPDPLDGGLRGYQGRCWDCNWQGTEFLRGDEEMGTPESRAHKQNARREVAEHVAATTPTEWLPQ